MLKRILSAILILSIIPLSSTQLSLSRNFFVNPENGQPRIKIVYGAYAAEEDYENALKIAQAVANKLCWMISEEPQYFWPDRKKGIAPSNIEVVLTPDKYGWLWYSGKPRHFYAIEGYDESKTHEEIKFKVDLSNKTILYVEYIIANIKPGDNIRFLGISYNVKSIGEDRLVCEGREFVSSTETVYWYNWSTSWFFKVYSDKIKLYAENVPMVRISTPIKTPTLTLASGNKWLLNIILERKDGTEFGYTVQCGEAYELEQTERTKVPIGVDPDLMLVRDTELTKEMKQEYNLIFVGGPGLVLQSSGNKKTANRVTEEIVLGRYSKINWYVSLGKYEYIERVFSTKNIVIVAGKDRESTTTATQLFIEKIKELA